MFMLVLGLLIRVSGVVSKTVSVTELQVSGQMLMHRLLAHLQRCDAGGLKFITEDNLCALNMHEVADVTPDSRKLYAERVLVWHWQGSKLSEHRSQPLGMDNRWQPSRLDDGTLRNLTGLEPGRTLSAHVVHLSVVAPDKNTPWLVRLDLERSTHRVRYEQFISLRDHF